MSLPVPFKTCDECGKSMKYCGAWGRPNPERWIQIGECKNSSCKWHLKQMPMHILPKVIEGWRDAGPIDDGMIE